MESPLLTRQEAAQYLKISVPQLDNLARRGQVRRVKMGEIGSSRSRVLYRKTDLDLFIDELAEGLWSSGRNNS